MVQRDEGVKIVVEAICAGVFNDLGSGSNVDVCVITKVSALKPNTKSYCLRGVNLTFSMQILHFLFTGT